MLLFFKNELIKIDDSHFPNSSAGNWLKNAYHGSIVEPKAVIYRFLVDSDHANT